MKTFCPMIVFDLEKYGRILWFDLRRCKLSFSFPCFDLGRAFVALTGVDARCWLCENHVNRGDCVGSGSGRGRAGRMMGGMAFVVGMARGTGIRIRRDSVLGMVSCGDPSTIPKGRSRSNIEGSGARHINQRCLLTAINPSLYTSRIHRLIE